MNRINVVYIESSEMKKKWDTGCIQQAGWIY